MLFRWSVLLVRTILSKATTSDTKDYSFCLGHLHLPPTHFLLWRHGPLEVAKLFPVRRASSVQQCFNWVLFWKRKMELQPTDCIFVHFGLTPEYCLCHSLSSGFSPPTPFTDALFAYERQSACGNKTLVLLLLWEQKETWCRAFPSTFYPWISSWACSIS